MSKTSIDNYRFADRSRLTGFFCLKVLAISAVAILPLLANAESIGHWGDVSLRMNGQLFKLKVADTDSKRQQGLMHVTHMPADSGMLFVFDKPDNHCMWMKNTDIPLTVIYLDSDGRYIDRYDMKPHDLTTHCSTGEAKYAVEVNQGIF